MRTKAETRLTPRERLTRGLTYSAVGPVDVTRGVVGLGVHSAQSAASDLRRRYREGRLSKEIAAAQGAIAQELAAAQEVVANLPQVFQEARQSPRHHSKRPWIIGGAAVAIVATGAVAFSIVRRSTRPDPSPLPPSVDVQPRP